MLFLKICAMFVLFSTKAHTMTRTVDYVDTKRFMGTWYVIGGRFTKFEKDVFNAVEKYKWNPKKNIIEIDFSYNQGSLTGPLKKIPQTAWIKNNRTNATWTVSPFWPLRFTYLVIALDDEYEWTVIGVPNQAYLWLMARSPKLSPEKINLIFDELERIHYSIDNFVFVKHH